jgi:hypothetical protein
MASRNTNLILLAALGIGAYLVYRFGRGAAKAIADTASATSSKVADIAAALIPYAASTPAFSVPPFQAPGMSGPMLSPYGLVNSIVLGDGSEIAPAQTRAAGIFTDTDNVVKIQFYYGGRTYRTIDAVPDSSGTLYAALA